MSRDSQISHTNKMFFLHNNSFDSQKLNLFPNVNFKFPGKTSSLHNTMYDKITLNNYN